MAAREKASIERLLARCIEERQRLEKELRTKDIELDGLREENRRLKVANILLNRRLKGRTA